MPAPQAPRPDGETLDEFYHGRIRVLQKKKGYRFSVDAPLLADFIRTRAGDEALELGAGNGIIPILLSVKPFKRVTAVEGAGRGENGRPAPPPRGVPGLPGENGRVAPTRGPGPVSSTRKRGARTS